MKLKELYEAAIAVGYEMDPRGREGVEEHLRAIAARYARMSETEKRFFDTERLSNPFGDTRIATGNPDTELSRVLIGIDIDGSELLLASALERSGKPMSAVISHHNSNIAGGLASRYDTAIPQVALAVEAGVPEMRALHIVEEVVGRVDASWNLRVTQIAEALEMPLMSIHSPADACLDHLLRTQIAAERPETVGDLVELVSLWPECQMLIDRARHAPGIDVGNAAAPLGHVYRCMYGGWNPTPELFEELCKAGVTTFVVVASTPAFREIAARYDASIVEIPHYAADNAGINIMLDHIMPAGDEFAIIEASNYLRYRR